MKNNEHKMTPRLCVIIPTYNNAGTVGEVVSQVYSYCQDVIVVNDGSTDRTSEILAALTIPVTVVSYEKNQARAMPW